MMRARVRVRLGQLEGMRGRWCWVGRAGVVGCWSLVGGSTIERDWARFLVAGLPGTHAAGRRSRWEPGAERRGMPARASRSAATASR